jgi:hypothetical protein
MDSRRSADPAVWQSFPLHVLREYAFLADGQRGALIGPRGDIVWLCAPTWDSDAVISSLVGGEGIYAVTPSAAAVWGGYYESGSLVWHSHWVTSSTRIECQEALAYPADPHRLVLLRRIEAVEREAAVRVRLDLRAGFGRHAMRGLHRGSDGAWSGRSGDLTFRWRGGQRARVASDGLLELDLVVPPGLHHDLVLEVSDRPLGDPPDADRAWADTRRHWRETVPDLTTCVAPRDARHAYAVITGLTAPDGGMVAASTLGLPERAEAGRNYDYRYVWMRDQAYAGLAASVAEPLPLMDVAVDGIVAKVLEHGDRLAPAYRVNGSRLPDAVELPLPGYPGGRAVVGNHVNGQFQLDSLGEILQLLAASARHEHLSRDGYRAMELVTAVIRQRWREPDAGIWELDNEWWTQSRLAVVAGLRSAAAQVAMPVRLRYLLLADDVLGETERRCLRQDGAWQRSPRHRGTDASLVLEPVRGALPANDPRTVATLGAVTKELTQDGYAYRFRQGDAPLGRSEGAFLLCGFSMSLALWHQGRSAEAARWFERHRSACGTPGLLSEEYDVTQRQMRGNLPQGFVHAMLLEASQRLALRPSPVPS